MSVCPCGYSWTDRCDKCLTTPTEPPAADGLRERAKAMVDEAFELPCKLTCESHYQSPCNCSATYDRLVRDLAAALSPSTGEARMRELPPFEEVWATYKAQGYQYGRDALENVEFGYEIAARILRAALTGEDG